MKKFVLFISLAILLVSCQAMPASQSTATFVPTYTIVPPTHTPEPTSTPIPPTPTLAPPLVPLNFVTDVQVLNTDNFDNLNNWDMWNSGTGDLSSGMFELTGQEGWLSGLVFKQKLGEGNGILLGYKTAKNSDFQSEFVFATGEWGTDSFRQFGVYNGKRPKADLYQGNQALGFNNLLGNLSLKADTWYNIFMAIGKDGELLAVVWNPDDPSKQLVYHEKIGEKWAGLKWEFQAKANIGETVYINNFLLLSFGGFK